jgi:hypothetical protein
MLEHAGSGATQRRLYGSKALSHGDERSALRKLRLESVFVRRYKGRSAELGLRVRKLFRVEWRPDGAGDAFIARKPNCIE